MEQLPNKEAGMRTCNVCGSTSFHEESVEAIFNIAGAHVLVEAVPALVCDRCGEETFSRETTERVRRLLHEEAPPTRQVSMDVVAFS